MSKKKPKKITSLDEWEKRQKRLQKNWKPPKFVPHPIPDWIKNAELPRPEWMSTPRKPMLPYPNPDGYCSYVSCGEHIRENDFFGIIDRHGLQPKLLCNHCFSLLVEEKNKKQQEAWDYLIAHRHCFM